MTPGSDAREINNWLVSGLMVVDVSMVYVTQTEEGSDLQVRVIS